MVLLDTVLYTLYYNVLLENNPQSSIKRGFMFFRFCENTLSWLPNSLILTLSEYLYNTSFSYATFYNVRFCYINFHLVVLMFVHFHRFSLDGIYI